MKQNKTYYSSGELKTELIIISDGASAGRYLYLKEYYKCVRINRMTYKIDYDEFESSYHRLDGPAYQSWYKNGQLKEKSFYINVLLHNTNGPAIQIWYKSRKIKHKGFFFNDEEYSSLEELQHAVKMNLLK